MSPPRLLTLVIGVALSALSGCVRVESAPDAAPRTRLLVTRDSTGVNLQWESEPGKGYTVYFFDSRLPNAKWEELQGATAIPGTGRLLRISDPAPGARFRKYRIETLRPVASSPIPRQ